MWLGGKFRTGISTQVKREMKKQTVNPIRLSGMLDRMINKL